MFVCALCFQLRISSMGTSTMPSPLPSPGVPGEGVMLRGHANAIWKVFPFDSPLQYNIAQQGGHMVRGPFGLIGLIRKTWDRVRRELDEGGIAKRLARRGMGVF